jgi:hypothetical protein
MLTKKKSCYSKRLTYIAVLSCKTAKWTGWIPDGDELKYLYAQALIGIGRIRKNQGKKMVALGFFIRALKEIPEREDVHRRGDANYTEAGCTRCRVIPRTIWQDRGIILCEDAGSSPGVPPESVPCTT